MSDQERVTGGVSAEDTAGAASGGLRRRHRFAVAVGEGFVTAFLVPVACWLWQRGTVPIVLPRPGGPPDVVMSYLGDRIAAAIGLVAVSGLLVLDAVRQLVRASRRAGNAPGR